MGQDQNHFSCQVFKIVDREFSIFKLDKDFKIVPKSKRVLQGHETQFLAGDWHNVPVVSNIRHLSIFYFAYIGECYSVTARQSTVSWSSPSRLIHRR